MPRKDTQTGPISAQAQQELVSEGIENFELPKSAVTRIAKSALPDNSKLQKETVHSLVKGSTVFINYLAATAHDVAVSKQHKSISASDVLRALELMEFGDMLNTLQNELNVYRDVSKNDKGKKSANGGASASAAGPSAIGASTPGATSASAPPNSKKSSAPVSGAATPSASTATLPPKLPLGHGLNAKPKPPTEGEDVVEDDDDLRALGGPSGLPPTWSPSKSGKVSDPMDVDPQDNQNAEPVEDEDQIMEDDEDQEEGEDLVDTVAMEDEEMRQDAKTLGGQAGGKPFKVAGFGATSGTDSGQS